MGSMRLEVEGWRGEGKGEGGRGPRDFFVVSGAEV